MDRQPKRKKVRLRHRWRRASEEAIDSSRTVRFGWMCRRCGFETYSFHEHPPPGSVRDTDGRDCAARVVAGVMEL